MTKTTKAGILVILALYLGLHVFTLSSHPFVHSDEAWLSVLTRAMVHNSSVSAVEEVFRATPRYPHALKTLFHIIQAPFLMVSWSVFAARLPSLIAGIAALYLTTRIAEVLLFPGYLRYLPACLMGLDPQFWFAAHSGRAEMLLTALMLLSLLMVFEKRSPVLVALPLAGAVFVHPNAFVIALPLGLIYLADLISTALRRVRINHPVTNKALEDRTNVVHELKRSFRNALVFVAVLGSAACAAILLSYLMDPDFPDHYRRFGESVGVSDSLVVKILGLPLFFRKMWLQESGTYYLPNARAFLCMGGSGFVGSLAFACFPKFPKGFTRLLYSLVLIPLGLLIGTTVVGKFSPPTLTFFLAPSYLLFTYFLSLLGWAGTKQSSGLPPEKVGLKGRAAMGRFFMIVAVISLLLPGILTTQELRSSLNRESYNTYTRFLTSHIRGNQRVLANLNSAFAFDYDRLVIWRDLSALATSDTSLESFLDRQDVGWIVLSDEMELVYNSRPVWNTLYGSPVWYPELLDIVARRGVLCASYNSAVYGMRIVPFMYRKSGNIRLYRLDK